MKFARAWIFLFITSVSLVHAQNSEPHDLSIIKSIDDLDLPSHYQEASEICLPEKMIELDDFTVLPESRVRDLFTQLERNAKARMRVAGGSCSYRRSYIQGYLRKLGISSGRLYIQCPSKAGRMRLIDQVTGRRYTFSNFHDTNVVAVQTGYQVMDVQFEDRPLSLGQYLGKIEASQKLKPLRSRSSGDRGYCYWSIN